MGRFLMDSKLDPEVRRLVYYSATVHLHPYLNSRVQMSPSMLRLRAELNVKSSASVRQLYAKPQAEEEGAEAEADDGEGSEDSEVSDEEGESDDDVKLVG